MEALGLQKFARILLSFLRKRLPDNLYFPITSYLKTILNTVYRRNVVLNSLLVNSHNQYPHNCSIAITFDLDSKKCWEAMPTIAQLNYKYQIPSTVHVLTSGSYNLNIERLRLLESFDCEIGIHGDYHDLAFCYRSIDEMLNRLKAMRNALPGFKLHSFRHPGLGISSELFSVLKQSGFLFDSSWGVGPFFDSEIFSANLDFPTEGINSFPIILSDDVLFREYPEPIDKKFELFVQTITFASQNLTKFVINFHPMIIIQHLDFYEKCISWISSKEQFKFFAIDELSNA